MPAFSARVVVARDAVVGVVEAGDRAPVVAVARQQGPVAFARSVGAANWRYAEFELWKEGVARWTEIELGKTFPDPAIKASANQLEHQVRAWLDKPDIANAGREFVYPYGAAEAMLLEACDPRWRARYPKTLALGPLLDMSRGRCG